MKKIVCAALFLACSFASPASANIDCVRDRAPVEQLICSDGELIVLDGKMSQRYFALRNFSGRRDADNLLQNQRSWLRERNQCRNTGCLKLYYNSRITLLQSVIDSY